MKGLLIILILISLFSCSSRNDVVRGGFLQKKKYNNGFNLSFKKKIVAKSKEEKEILVLEKKQQVKRKEKQTSKLLDVKEIEEKEQRLTITTSLQERIETPRHSILNKLQEQYILQTKVSDERDNGVNKILIKKIKTFTLSTIIAFILYVVFTALVFFNANLILSLVSLGLLVILLISFFSAIKSLVKYVKCKYEGKEDLSPKESTKLRYAKRLSNFSKLVLILLGLFLVMIVFLVFAPFAVVNSIAFGLLFLLIVGHYIAFLIMTIVNYLILLIMSIKEMKEDLGKKKMSENDYYYE